VPLPRARTGRNCRDRDLGLPVSATPEPSARGIPGAGGRADGAGVDDGRGVPGARCTGVLGAAEPGGDGRHWSSDQGALVHPRCRGKMISESSSPPLPDEPAHQPRQPRSPQTPAPTSSCPFGLCVKGIAGRGRRPTFRRGSRQARCTNSAARAATVEGTPSAGAPLEDDHRAQWRRTSR